MIARASRWLDIKINTADHAARKRCTATPCLTESWRRRSEMKQVLRNRGWMSMVLIGVSTVAGCKSAGSEGPSASGSTVTASAISAPSAPPTASPAAASASPPSAPVDPATYVPRCKAGEEPACAAACDGGDMPSCSLLGDLLWKKGDRDAKEQARVKLRKACDANIGRACWSLAAKLKRPGLRATPQEEQSYDVECFQLNSKACDLNDGNGCFSASRNLVEGSGGPPNPGKGEALLRKAIALLTKECSNRDVVSCRALGLLYETGRSVPKDVKKAATYFKRACDQGDEIGCLGAKRMGAS